MRAFPTNVYCVRYRFICQIFVGHILCARHWGCGTNKTKTWLSSNGGTGQTVNNEWVGSGLLDRVIRKGLSGTWGQRPEWWEKTHVCVWGINAAGGCWSRGKRVPQVPLGWCASGGGRQRPWNQSSDERPSTAQHHSVPRGLQGSSDWGGGSPGDPCSCEGAVNNCAGSWGQLRWGLGTWMVL